MKPLLKISAIILILVICFTLNQHIILPYFNESVMYGSYTPKRARADSIEGEKVIIAGGSASNLGFDSEYFQQLSGKPAVNLSISAGIPLKVYMRAAELCANPGDTIILPLEYSYYAADFDEISESYVDMVGVDPDLKCDESFGNNIEFFSQSFLRSFTRAKDCCVSFFKDSVNWESTIYIADSVDAYGDFCMHKDRPSTYVSKKIFNSFQYNSDIFVHIKSYIDTMESKGVTVYLTYPCVDKNSFEDSDQYFSEVQQVVAQYIPQKNVIGTPHNFGYDPEYFFDTVYHLAYENRSLYTETLFTYYKEKAK
jgi:hypothetical protein